MSTFEYVFDYTVHYIHVYKKHYPNGRALNRSI